MKHITLTLLFLSLAYITGATTWSAAIPYTQTCDGQQVTIKAIAYEPYMPYPYGATTVYYKKQLLYTIDRYFRDPSFASDDGRYFAVLYTSNTLGISSYTNFGINQINYGRPAIEIYKDGRPYKTYTLTDIIDTNTLQNNGVLYNWGYSINWDKESVASIKFECESCIEVYGKKSIADCDTNDIDPEECISCKNACDSLELFNKELNFLSKSIFIKNNAIHILTNQDKVVIVDFNKDGAISEIPFNALFDNKYDFNPPKVNTVYSEIEMPEKFAEPLLSSGKQIDSALADYLGTSVYKHDTNRDYWSLVISSLVINKHGLCEEIESPYWHSNKDSAIRKYSPRFSNKELQQKIEEWLMLQHYDTSLIPKGFDKYSFRVSSYFTN